MDFDDAYANMLHIPDAPSFVAEWPERAATFRQPGNISGLTSPMVVTRVSALICFCRRDWQKVLLFSFMGDIGAPLPRMIGHIWPQERLPMALLWPFPVIGWHPR